MRGYTPRHMNRYHFGDSCTAKPDRHTPRHAGESPNLKDYLPDDRNTRTVVGLAAAFAMVVTGVVVVGVPTDRGDANTSIQQPEERKSAESTGTPPQPERLDSFVDRAAEENTIVDGGSYVTPCSLGQQEGWIRGNVFCPRPNLSVRSGTRPVGDSNSNMSSAAIDSRKQPTSA